MTVYIEEFLIENILINICLLRLIYLTTKCFSTNFRLILSSIFGASVSVFITIFINDLLVLNIIKFVCACLMIAIAFKGTKKQFIFNFLLLFAFTYMFGGALQQLNSVIRLPNLTIITLIIIALTYIYEKVVKHLKFKLTTSNLIYTLTLKNKNRSVKINAFLDTGNLLKFEDKPVIIIDLSSYLKLTNNDFMSYYLQMSNSVNTSTVAGSQRLKIFKIDSVKIEINGKSKEIKNQYIAVNSSKCFNKTNYKALLNPLML